MTANPPELPSGSTAPRSHAGAETGGLNVVVFDTPEQLREMLTMIGIKTDPAGRLLHPDTGKPIACCSCSADVGVTDVGHVMPGSVLVYCKDPVCILDYIERFG